jgi:hypothetical protein
MRTVGARALESLNHDKSFRGDRSEIDARTLDLSLRAIDMAEKL